MPLFLPTRNALVDKTLMATASMWAWMRDITAAFNGGNGFAPADATYFLRTADTSLPNARVATNSATVTLDYSTPGQVKWNASGTSEVLVTTTTFTNAQIIALADSVATIVSAQGASTRIQPLLIDLDGDFSAGAYGNVNADAFIYSAVGDGTGAFTDYLANDSSIPVTWLDAFLTVAQHAQAVLVPSEHTEPVNDWGNLARTTVISAAVVNQPLNLYFSNNGSGALSGGNAANSLIVTAYYVVIS